MSPSAPPPREGRWSLGRFSMSAAILAVSITGVPTAPLDITLTICLKNGRKRICTASTTRTSSEEDSENRLSASAAVNAIGVSHRTGFPASMQSLTWLACSDAGVAIYTRLTF